MVNSNTVEMGRKVFFLYPTAFIQNVIIDELIQQEFEIYVYKDEIKLQRILKKYRDAIVLACIDEGPSPSLWETWVRYIMKTEVTRNVSIGILSNTNNDDARRLYQDNLKVPCGFIQVKTDKAKTVKTLQEVLNAAGAKGRRKYVRADTYDDPKVTINLLSRENTYIIGQIRDISVVGLSCVFSGDPQLEKNSRLPDIQIKLHSVLLKAAGIVFGSREENYQKIYVFLFTPKPDSSTQTKIRAFIQKKLQSKIDTEM